MASIPGADPGTVLGRVSVALAVLAVGTCAALAAVFSSIYGIKVAVAVGVGIPIAILVVLRPRIGVLLFFFALAFLEEFPGGISDQDVARSARLPFYSLTFGLPAVYPPDFIVAGLLGLYFLRKMLWSEGYGMRLDKIGLALLLLAATMVASVTLGFMGDKPLGPDILDLSLLGAVDIPETAARYIAVLQIKLFCLLFASYLLGLVYFRSERDIRDMIVAFTLAMLGTIALGGLRLYHDPTMVRKLVAVIYDTGSVTLMAMAVFYMVLKWSCHYYSSQHSFARSVFAILLMLFILLSFRRTLWGAIAMSTALLPFLTPRSGRARVLLLIAAGAVIAGIAVATLPGGQVLVQSLLARAEETTLNDASTLYRYALLVWVVERFADLPLFGWGIKPLWNETIHIRFFTANMENVHSLYYWLLVRFGIVGLFVSAVGTVLAMLRIREVWSTVARDDHRILLTVVTISILMFLFGGLVNPVYASVRLIVPLGLGLALVTRLPDIASAGNGSPR